MDIIYVTPNIPYKWFPKSTNTHISQKKQIKALCIGF